MEFLQSLIPFINRDQFIFDLGSSIQLRRFFELLVSQGIDNDQQAQTSLYQNSDNGQIAYKKLKQRLRDKLTDHIVRNGATFKNLDNYASQYCKCMTQMLAVKTLNLSLARTAATHMGENLLKILLKNEFTDLTVFLLRDLHYYYSSINYNKAKARKYEDMLLSMEELFSHEIEAARYYCNLRIIFGTSHASKKETTLPKAIMYSDKLKRYLDSPNTSYQLYLMIYSVMAMRYEMAQDYTKLLQTCDEAVETFRHRRVNRKVAFYLFDIHRIVCNIQFERYHEAESIADGYFRQMTSAHINWFTLKRYILAGRLYGKNYNGAYQIMMEVQDNKALQKMPPNLKQTWQVYSAYIHFLTSINRVTERNSTQVKFRLYKFLNEIPIFTKDKRGLNISILIVHVLILLVENRYSEIIDRVDALNQYCHRHLRRDETFRSNCFIKMMLKTAQAEFVKKRAERYSEPLYAKLKIVPRALSDESIEVEIIPYEELWRMVLDLLD